MIFQAMLLPMPVITRLLLRSTFELWTASRTPDCKVVIVMPPAEAAAMNKAVLRRSGSVLKLQHALQNIAVEKANASVQEDRRHILQLIEQDVGFAAMNKEVTVSCKQSL